MLVRITHRCRMGCNHCMADASPSGEHMSADTFARVVRFTVALGDPILLISGGEPTEHPLLPSFLDRAAHAGLKSMVLSNGMFLADPGLRDLVLSLATWVQITHDDRFYPRKIEHWDHPKIRWETQLRVVSPFGRAVSNGLTITKRAPSCFNLRSATRAIGNLRDALRMLWRRGRFCTPSVNLDGSLSAGEAPSCSTFGIVDDDTADLAARLCGIRCARCGLVDNLTSVERHAIGEGVPSVFLDRDESCEENSP